jgi:hypothetical protein
LEKPAAGRSNGAKANAVKPLAHYIEARSSSGAAASHCADLKQKRSMSGFDRAATHATPL